MLSCDAIRQALADSAEAGHIPAVAYAYVEGQSKQNTVLLNLSLAVGKKNTEKPSSDDNLVSKDTLFPASSLSKIIFTYLLLELVAKQHFDLDRPLHEILAYERFKIDDAYPEKARQLTARHVLSHSSGLANFGEDLTSKLTFSDQHALGEGYSYSGEAFLYLQKVIEKHMGQDLESLANTHVFHPLGMERTSFDPELDDDVVKVHSELGKACDIYVGEPRQNAAGSLLTTAADFEKFLNAWLEKMDHEVFQQAFQSSHSKNFPLCGLGWHLYRHHETDDLIAYQYGQNPNTRAFLTLNVSQKKAAAYFTNSDNGMSIANRIFNSDNLPQVADLREVFQYLHYTQCDEPGWQVELMGRIAESRGDCSSARKYFVEAVSQSDNDVHQRRLDWFDSAHHFKNNKPIFANQLKKFQGEYENDYQDKIILSLCDDAIVFSQYDQEIKCVRVAENEFLPETDQAFKITLDGEKMSIDYLQGYQKTLFKKNACAKKNISEQASHENIVFSALINSQSSFFKALNERELIEKRHDSLQNQRAFDKRYGLIVK